MNEVESKIAIVTGAIRGIGKATSSRFKREGITVIETDIPDQDRNIPMKNQSRISRINFWFMMLPKKNHGRKLLVKY
ncbi:MAG: hypothetical protein Ct9H300mP28_14260 [Pseudomonadota bacterium]|nr:MAG: hypothetical protein Ct9H300mP28_14260 [Pseudomonadota bacterium]